MSHPLKCLARTRAFLHPPFRSTTSSSPSFRCFNRTITMGSLDNKRAAIADQVKFDIFTQSQEAVRALSDYLSVEYEAYLWIWRDVLGQ